MGYVKFTEQVGEISKTYEFGSYEDFKDWENKLTGVLVSSEENLPETNGWITNNGIKPLHINDSLVKVMFRDGSVDEGRVFAWAWHHTNEPDDIMSYRVVDK